MYIIVSLLMALGLAGAIVQIWPSTPLVLLGLIIWAIYLGGPTPWVTTAVCTLLLILAMVLKILIPGKQLKQAGIPNSTMLWGGLGAVAGFFLIPVVGIFVGFIGGVAGAEYQRLQNTEATKAAVIKTMKTIGISALIEFSLSLLAVLIWVAASLYLAFG